ncbi:PTS glucose/sucrose transporter subunit IIB, partial [Streptomyces sp. NPDC001848]|uniref:PTS glucose/sucrose transporter subunit IIB n=1 Tax=Streptomyces sp. NPDC001848 TaxID=3364618 RepID=UPI00368B3913
MLPLVGGPANVTSVAHCMTRLRLGLADRSLVDEHALRALPEVLGVVDDDTYQIVLGPGKAAQVTAEFETLVRTSAEELASRGAASTGEPAAREAASTGEPAAREAASTGEPAAREAASTGEPAAR